MTDDEPIITTGNPGLAKLAMWLLGLVTTLGTYIWNHMDSKLDKLEAQHSADHETIADLRTRTALSEARNADLTVKVDRILTIVERRR